MTLKNLLKTAAAIAALSAAGIGGAFAEPFPAYVNVLGVTTIEQQRALNFGNIIKPFGLNTVVVTISAADPAVIGAVPPASYLGGGQSGIYVVNGTAGAEFALGMTPGSCDPGLTLSAMTESSPILPYTVGGANPIIGGTLTVNSAVAIGPNQQCNFTLTLEGA
jgi:hypothetical protein